MAESREERLSKAYTKLHAQLCEIFYNEDPDGMGVSAGAPDDEYSPEVSNLIPRLRDLSDREAVARVVREIFPKASDSLTDQVFDAWTSFLRELD